MTSAVLLVAYKNGGFWHGMDTLREKNVLGSSLLPAHRTYIRGCCIDSMSDIAIQVEDLSKRYRIGMREEASDTFVGAVSNIMARPVKNFRRLRSLSTFSKNGHHEEDIIWALQMSPSK